MPEVLDVERLPGGRLVALRLPAQSPGTAWLLARDSAARSAGVAGRTDLRPHVAGRPAPGHLWGRINGWQLPDGSAGWRLDFDPFAKGVHVNWWRVEPGVRHQGAVRVPGADEAFFFELLRRHFPTTRELETETGGPPSRVEQVALALPPARRLAYLQAALSRQRERGRRADAVGLPDGSTAFLGRGASGARVLDPQGRLWRIDAGDPAQLRPGRGPDYGHPAVTRVLPYT